MTLLVAFPGRSTKPQMGKRAWNAPAIEEAIEIENRELYVRSLDQDRTRCESHAPNGKGKRQADMW